MEPTTSQNLKQSPHKQMYMRSSMLFVGLEQKRNDSFDLLDLMRDFTGFEPRKWGPSIIGFGSYYYKSERSRQKGNSPLVGFSPRKGKDLYLRDEAGRYRSRCVSTADGDDD